MALKIAQSDEWVRPGWWKWAVWIDGTPAELDDIVEVKYLLHPTFADPVKVVRDRKSAFRVKSAGWGEFTIRAEVKRKTGSSKLSHKLKLHEPTTATAKPKELQVFISHSSIDGGKAGELTRALQSRGLKVNSSAASTAADLPWRQSLAGALADSHAVVALESDTPSEWLDWELSQARNLKKPVYHVRISGSASPSLHDEQVVQVGPSANVDQIAEDLVGAFEPLRAEGPKPRSRPALGRRLKKG